MAGRAETALRSHILASVDDAHGPKNELPPEFDGDSLASFVAPLE